MKQYTVMTIFGDRWNETFTDRRELEEITEPSIEQIMVRDGDTGPWRFAGPDD